LNLFPSFYDYIVEGLIKMTFEEVYKDYIDIVYNYLRQRLRDSYLIEDILQETFYAVYRSLQDLKKKDSIKSWILSIAHNKMVDKLRKEGKETLPDLTDNGIGPASNPMPEEALFLEEMLQKLPGEDRQILYGLYVLQLKYSELAEIMQLPEGTIKSKAYYARKQLREWLKEGAG